MREKFIVLAKITMWMWILVWTAADPVLPHGDIHQQIERVSRLLEQDGDNADLYYKRGRLHLEHEGWTEALADLGRARELAPDLVEVDYHRARALLGAGEPARADQVLTAHLRRLGQGAERKGAVMRGNFLRGRVLRAAGRPLDAAAAFERAVTAASEPLPDQYLEWARALEAAGESHLASAVAVLDRGIERLGPLVTLQLPAIEMEVDRGEYRPALRRLDRLIAAMPRPATYLHRRGQVLRQAGCGDEARSSYEKALAALAEIPRHRRQTRAVSGLEARIRADLEALPSTSAPCDAIGKPP